MFITQATAGWVWSKREHLWTTGALTVKALKVSIDSSVPFAAIVCQQSRTLWRPLANTLEILTTCFSTAPSSLLPMPHTTWPLCEITISST